MQDLLSKLNPAQREAVTHLDGPLMIIAGAGSGKTRVITHRIAFLHRECGIPLHRIMAVTFTNKAAREMRERVCRLLDVPDSPGLAIGTFHARCAMILRRDAEAAGLSPSFAILDENDQKQAIKRVLKEMGLSEKLARPAAVQQFINQAKMKLLTPEDCAAEMDEGEVPYPNIYARYQKTITQAASVDFEDLLMLTVRLLQNNPAARQRWSERYSYLLVDEYQDTNHAQFLLTKLLAEGHRQVCIVGDEDQSIYSWRGAEISNLLDFEKTFPGTRIIKLEQNYRSTEMILRAASTVIRRNTQRIGKELFTEQKGGEPITFLACLDAAGEGRRIAGEASNLIASGTSPNEIAIFYRGHWLSRSIEDALRQYRVPYRIVGGLRFYDRKEIKDLLSFLRLAVNPDDDLAFERVLNVPPRGIGAKTEESLMQAAAAAGISLRRACAEAVAHKTLPPKPRAALAHLLDCVDKWSTLAIDSPPSAVLDAVLKDTNYREDGVGDVTTIEAESRLENINEFESLVDSFNASGPHHQLMEFLTSMSLDATEEQEDDRPKVNLLTIHNAKGLEFDNVFVIGMEQGVFPTSRALDSKDPTAIEEERRLFYVAITRARRRLWLSYAAQRNRPDFWARTEPSMFLSEMPADVFTPDSVAAMRRVLGPVWAAGEGGGRTTNATAPGIHARPQGAVAPASGSRPAARYRVGMKVVHRYMGAGVISELGGRPGWERAMVCFEDGREQEFVLKYAPLTIVE